MVKSCEPLEFELSIFLLASSENLEHSMVGALDDDELNQTDRSSIQHRANTTMHVCWHRNLSVSINDHRHAIKNQLSGYLLRKFKNSNGWQKLWVVFTNFCLFFYKTYQVIRHLFSIYDTDLIRAG